MQEAFVDVNSIPTHIITWGKCIEESLDNVQEVVICIPGNPGLPGFYTEFGGTLQQQLGLTGRDLPVWVIGHAGHYDPPEAEVPQLTGNEELFNLNGQVTHKIEFIKKYIPRHVKIHLIGHSIGAWMTLQLLQKKQIRDRIKKCYLLFPTVERMAESPNGQTFTNIVMPFYSVFGNVLFNLLKAMPIWLQSQIYLRIFSIPCDHVSTALKCQPSVAEKAAFLVDDEMARVRGLQCELIEQHLPLLKFYYGAKDDWVPVAYYEELIRLFPQADAQLDTKGIDHAFVLSSSKPMALIVSNMIQQTTN
ncbi:lipid droplet-associated hydrolase-like isoform X1 [Drosophila busckii]|uniref:lipid droplet-associated hydrolase-like isoform X1 n=1 Tax=Drosophila busckii TaxID=30019 RepID=UPI001433045C|nr:lipid droplet-associated hydrolase-like isoform X1 [Drosophila busckii]XP_033149694.1 lipid droplet-associated hydrolase-like isoform X1 [Drosophila busckii]XP_033149695.1 lipid droplet-associated hydrolase-like isoform X1 [Drosophila busckii]